MMKNLQRINELLLCSCLAALLFAAPAGASTAVVIPGGSTSASATPVDIVQGYEFIPSTAILLTAIGVYDAGSNGLSSPHTVAVWADDGSIIAQELFAFGAGFLEDGFQYLSVIPILLEADRKYVIGVLFPSTNLDSVALALFDSEYTLHPSILITEGRTHAGGFGLPLTESDEIFFGPNFQFTTVPVPAAVWMLLSALGTLLITRRAR